MTAPWQDVNLKLGRLNAAPLTQGKCTACLLRKACCGPDGRMNHHEASLLCHVARSPGDEVKVSGLRITLQRIVPDGNSFRERGVWNSQHSPLENMSNFSCSPFTHSISLLPAATPAVSTHFLSTFLRDQGPGCRRLRAVSSLGNDQLPREPELTAVLRVACRTLTARMGGL